VGKRRAAIGLAVSALFVALLLWQVDGGELREAFGEAQPAWLAVAFAVYLGALWLRGLRWRLVLRGTAEVGTADATALVVIGYAANNVLPVRLGELVRAQLLHDRHGADRLAGLGTIVVERVLDGLVLALFLVGTVALAGGNEALRGLAAIMAVAFLALSLGLLALGPALARKPERLAGLLRPLPSALRPRASRWAGGLVQGMTGVSGTMAWSRIVALTAASWAAEAATYWLVGVGFGLELDPLLYLGVCGAANLAIAVPSTAGGIGPFEYFAREVVVVFGASVAAGTAYAIALHALLLIPIVAIGLLLLWRRHIAVGAILHADAVLAGPEAGRPAELRDRAVVEHVRRVG
jgi:uncharacterized protein (TIRG00374 family)